MRSSRETGEARNLSSIAPTNVYSEAGLFVPNVDVSANRAARKWTPCEMLVRALWELLRGPLFLWTPRPLWGWRRGVLRLFGARVGREAHLHPTVRIAVPWTLTIGDDVAVGEGAILYGLGPIRIGARATISQYAHLCAGTHDHSRHDMPLIKSHIEIGEDAWICADAFIGPDVHIGARAIVAARAVVVKDVEPSTIVGGNPAAFIKHNMASREPSSYVLGQG